MKTFQRIRMLSWGLSLIAIGAFLSGCTPEKAEALLTASEAFKNESKKAISAYESLLMAGLDAPTLSEKEAISDIIDRAKAFSSKRKELTFNGVTRGLQDPFKSGKAEIKALVQRQNMLYDAFSDSLVNLSRGSYFAAEQVQCAEEIARRLVINIANYKTALEKRPINLVVQEEEAAYNLENVIKNGTDVEKQESARKIYALFNKKKELNNRVILQAALAAETGVKVIKAAENFDELSAVEMINLVRQALVITGTLEGLNSARAISRLDSALTEARGDAHWQKILDMEVYAAGTICNPIEASSPNTNPQ